MKADSQAQRSSRIVGRAEGLRLVEDQSQSEILPVFWDDNYISLLPGEKRAVGVHIRKIDLAGWHHPKLLVDGFNIPLTGARESQH